MIKETEAQARVRMGKALEDLRHALAGVRTGRASAALFEHVRVDYYGTPTPLNQVATVGVPEPTLVIDKALRSSDLGLNPANDGKILRVPIPALTEERRKELVKHLHKLLEDHRTAIRNIRRDANEELKRLLKDKKISQDDERRGLEEIQKMTDEFSGKLEAQGKAKEKEILEIR